MMRMTQNYTQEGAIKEKPKDHVSVYRGSASVLYKINKEDGLSATISFLV